MSDFKLGNGGKMGRVNPEQLKGGIKKENIKDKSMQNIFDSVDVNKDGVLDADEIKNFQARIMDAAGNDTLSAREAKKFLKKNNIKDVDKKDLLKFINQLSQSSENIADSKVINNKGQKTVVITYKDGSTETIHPDKSSEVSTKGDNGETITSYYDKDKKLKSKQTVNQNGQKEVSNFDENGKLKQIELTGEGGSPVQTIEMENDKPVSATIKNGATSEAYIYDENGEPVLMSKLENEGIPAKEKRTEYTYNEDGTVTENITEYGKETTRTVKDGKVVSETIKEQGKTTEKAYDENGHTETVNDGKTTSTTTFNNENKKLSQTKVVDGQEYNVEYDGKGNTKVILQNGESIEALAKKFGCTKEELLEANGGKIRGWAGDDVVVPGELEADDKRLQGRQTKEEAIAAYQEVADEIQAVNDEATARKSISFTNKDYTTYEELAGALFRREGIENPSKRQLEARIEDLQKTNPELKDGELKGKRVTANVSEGMHERISGKEEAAKEYQKSVADRKAAEGIAKEFYEIADNNAGMNSMKKMQELLDTKVTKDNILDVLDAYDKYKEGDSSIIDAVTSEVGAGGTKAQKQVLTTILDKLCKAAEAEGVSPEDIKHAREEFLSSMDKEMNATLRRTNPKDMEKAVDFLRGAIVAKQAGGEEITDEEAIATFNQDFAATDADARKTYQDAREAEGWTAKAGDTVLGWFGCTTIEDMDKKLGDNADAVKRLASVAENPEEFKTAYKEVFGVEFDKNKIAARDTALGNYQQAQNLSSTVNITTEILKGADNKDYGTLRNEIKEKFQLDDETIDNVISSYAQTIGKEAETDAGKRTMLMRFLESTQENSRAEYQNLTQGKTLEQMGKDLDLLTKSAFGTKDIVKDVVQFNENQQTTEMVTEAAFEIAGTVALQFVPGLGQMAAARLAVSAAKWGTKAVKVANYAAKAEKAFAATKNLQNMNKATQIGTQMLNAGAATMAVDLSNGKSVKEATSKALMNMSFAGVGASSSILAPKLMQTFGITNKALANEIAEEIMNAAGTYGVTKFTGGEYGSQDALIDFASGLIMSRISHVKTPAAKAAADTPAVPETPAAPPRDNKPKNDPPKTPKAKPENAPALDIASSNGNATPSSVKVGDKKADQIREDVNQAVSNPDISGEDLAQLRQEAGGIQNRDVRREVQQKVDVAAEKLSPEKHAEFEAANRANAQKNVDHIFEKHSELNSADTRVMNEYINNTDDPAVLRELKDKLNEKEHTYGGVTANYDRLRKAIDDKIATIEPAQVKTNTQQHDEVVAMLNEKAQTGKGLGENDFVQVKEYLATINDEAQIKELKGLLDGKKMTSAQKKQLKEALTAKTEELKNAPAAAQQPAPVSKPAPAAEPVKETPATPVHNEPETPVSKPAPAAEPVKETPATPVHNKPETPVSKPAPVAEPIKETPAAPVHKEPEPAVKPAETPVTPERVSDGDVDVTPEPAVKSAETPAVNNELEVRYPTPEEKMAMGQIGNNINRAKTSADLDKAQEWLDKMPECDQKSRLAAQLDAKRQQLTADNNVDAFLDYSKAQPGTKLPKDSPVLLTGNETLRLANYDLDLSSPQIKSRLDAMKEGDVITVGREGDIEIDSAYNQVSRKHLTIEKTPNGYIVKDTSANGTSIGQKPQNAGAASYHTPIEQSQKFNQTPAVKPAETPAANNEPEVRYPTPEEKMAMGQIGNNINRAKTSADLDKAQKWLDKMPECDQKSRLAAQLETKRQQLTDDNNPDVVVEIVEVPASNVKRNNNQDSDIQNLQVVNEVLLAEQWHQEILGGIDDPLVADPFPGFDL